MIGHIVNSLRPVTGQNALRVRYEKGSRQEDVKDATGGENPEFDSSGKTTEEILEFFRELKTEILRPRKLK